MITLECALMGFVPPGIFAIYEDCVINRDDDIYRKNMYGKVSPTGKRYIISVRRCISCGTVLFGKHFKKPVCMKCTKSETNREFYHNYNDPPKTKYENEHLRDITKWDCKKREKCLDKYIKYETIPCKICTKYIKDLRWKKWRERY